MKLDVYFLRHDYQKLRVWYRGIGEFYNCHYYVHDGIWFSNGIKLKAGIELTIRDCTGIIGNTVTT
tara:strand:- start:198 stop:395 length:198 start_codon:yes stop_codon:yes gene_type:complete